MAAEILGLNPDRGDVLNVYRLSFVPAWKQALMANNILERMLPFLLWGGFLTGLLLVLYALAHRLLMKWMGLTPPGKKVEVFKGTMKGKGGAQADAPAEGKGPEDRPPEAESEEPAEAQPTEIPGFQKPFAYIDSTNIERLAMLVQELEYPTQSVAAVLGFLPVELRIKLLEHLDGKSQKEVLQFMCRMRKVAPEFLSQFDAQLREEIAHSYGGVMDTTEWLEAMSPQQCEVYLAFLEKVEPLKARNIRNRLIRFEDLLLLPEDQLPILVNSVPVTEWGPALSGVGGLADPVLAILPEESRNALRQRLEFERPSPEAVLQVRAKVLSRAREMLRQGRLKLSRKAPAQAAAPAQARPAPAPGAVKPAPSTLLGGATAQPSRVPPANGNGDAKRGGPEPR
jgi:flagellar motor switch protein FliG